MNLPNGEPDEFVALSKVGDHNLDTLESARGPLLGLGVGANPNDIGRYGIIQGIEQYA